MKLLMISGDRQILAGKQGAFWHTLDGLRTRFERIDVITPGKVRGQRSGVRSLGTLQPFANVFFHPSPHGLWYQPMWIKKCGSKLITEHHHDVMTVHEYPPFYNGLGARSLAKRFSIPTLVEIHHIVGDPVPSSASETVGFWMSRLFLPADIRFATAVRTVNHRVMEALTSWGIDENKVHIIPSFYLDEKALRSVPDAVQHFDVAFAARLVRNKGWKSLLQAVATLPEISLLLLGDGPDKKAIEKEIAKLGIANRVTLGGWRENQKDLWAEMKRAKMFVMCSLSEGGPRVALEAMALGLPVIATNVGVMPDVIQDGINGLFTSGDAYDLANKIRIITSDPFMVKRMGTAAKRILERFEKTASLNTYADFLQSLARK